MYNYAHRKLFAKEGFLEGNRQRWLIIFLAFGAIIMGLDAYHLLKDPTPYLTFLTFCAGSFILGYSGSETMKLFRANSSYDNQNSTSYSDSVEDRNINFNEQILSNNAKESDYNIQEVEL